MMTDWKEENPHGFADLFRLVDGLLGQRFLGEEDEEKENDNEKEGAHREWNEIGDLDDRGKGWKYGFEEWKNIDQRTNRV